MHASFHHLLEISIPLPHHLRSDFFIAYQSQEFSECLDSRFPSVLSEGAAPLDYLHIQHARVLHFSHFLEPGQLTSSYLQRETIVLLGRH